MKIKFLLFVVIVILLSGCHSRNDDPTPPVAFTQFYLNDTLWTADEIYGWTYGNNTIGFTVYKTVEASIGSKQGFRVITMVDTSAIPLNKPLIAGFEFDDTFITYPETIYKRVKPDIVTPATYLTFTSVDYKNKLMSGVFEAELVPIGNAPDKPMKITRGVFRSIKIEPIE